MTTIAKYLIMFILSVLVFSCNFDIDWSNGKKGNGVVKTEARHISENFSQIEVDKGLDVYITESETTSISVEADENLMKLITTSVEAGVLKISAKEQIGKATSKKIVVHAPHLDKISAGSGSDVYSTNTIIAENLTLMASSGSDLIITVDSQSLDCIANSGADLKVSGTTNHLNAQASSGSDIKAADLVAKTCNTNASSGADIEVNCLEKLSIKASSGGDVDYSGEPKLVEKNGVTTGDVTKK